MEAKEYNWDNLEINPLRDITDAIAEAQQTGVGFPKPVGMFAIIDPRNNVICRADAYCGENGYYWCDLPQVLPIQAGDTYTVVLHLNIDHDGTQGR